jgi:hypothetical protein
MQMIHEVAASGKMAIDGTPVKAGVIVAKVDTVYPLDDILAGIRTGQFTITQKETPTAAPKTGGAVESKSKPFVNKE